MNRTLESMKRDLREACLCADEARRAELPFMPERFLKAGNVLLPLIAAALREQNIPPERDTVIERRQRIP